MARFCPTCGTQNQDMAQFCQNCQNQLQPTGYPPSYNSGYPPPRQYREQGADKKIAAGICGILLGALGVHKFILGYNTEGIIMLLASVLTCGIGAMVTGVIGIVGGIIYLTKSDEEFVQMYVHNKKGWF